MQSVQTPDRDSHINSGTIGLANIEKRHRGKKVYKAAQEKQDKEAKKEEQWNNTQLLETKSRYCVINSQQSSPSPQLQGSFHSHKPHRFHHPLTRQNRSLVKILPESVPEASEFDKLAVFVGTSREFDDPWLDADELWETVLNRVLKSALG